MHQPLLLTPLPKLPLIQPLPQCLPLRLPTVRRSNSLPIGNYPKSPIFVGLFLFLPPLLHLLTSHIPAVALPYCGHLHAQFPFQFRVVRPRRTRFGDFRVLPDRSMHITVNADMNPYAFLLTYVHEVAHCAVYRTYKRPGPPHGKIWQTTFQRLMAPLLTDAVFPPDLLPLLQRYFQKPAATTAGHPALRQALSKYDINQSQSVDKQCAVEIGEPLWTLPDGQPFLFQKKTFVRGKLRRTRVVCKEVRTGRSYAILADVRVEVIN